MKIIAVGRNYVDHIEELKNEQPSKPVVFMKADTAILKNNEPFYHPEFSKDIHHELELVLRVSKEGKYIDEQFALQYVDQIGLGIDFTARDLQSELKEKGLPWELAKSFNGSAPISEFRKISDFENIHQLNFHLLVNGNKRQVGDSSKMIFSFEKIIAFISQYFTLKTGDLIFTGTPAGVSRVAIGDRLEAFLENEKMMDFYVK